MNIHQLERAPKKAEVLYMSNNGQVKSLGNDQHTRGKGTGSLMFYVTNALLSVSHGTSPMTMLRVSNPGSVYNGQALTDQEFPTPRSGTHNTVPVLKLSPSLASSKHELSDGSSTRHRPAQLTLTRMSPDTKSIGTPVSRRSVVGSPSANSQGTLKDLSMSLQKVRSKIYISDHFLIASIEEHQADVYQSRTYPGIWSSIKRDC